VTPAASRSAFSVEHAALTPDRRAFGHNCKLSRDAVGFQGGDLDR